MEGRSRSSKRVLKSAAAQQIEDKLREMDARNCKPEAEAIDFLTQIGKNFVLPLEAQKPSTRVPASADPQPSITTKAESSKEEVNPKKTRKMSRQRPRFLQQWEESRGDGGHIYTIESLDALKIKPLEYIIDRLIVEKHVTVMGGRRGIGKTIIGTQMGTCLACGKDFLGRKVNRPYRVLFIDLENGDKVIQPRHQSQREALGLTEKETKLLKENWRYYDGHTPGEDGISPGFGPSLNITDEFRPEIIFIDNLGQIFVENSKDEEAAKDFVRSIEAFRCKFQAICIILFHHVIKLKEGENRPKLLFQPDEFIECIRGNGRLMDYTPSRLAIAEEAIKGDDTYYVVNGRLRGGQVAPLILRLNSDTYCFELESEIEFLEDTVFAKAPKQRELIKELKQKFPNGFSFTEAEKLVESPPSHRTFLKTLQRADGPLLERVGKGRYRWVKR